MDKTKSFDVGNWSLGDRKNHTSRLCHNIPYKVLRPDTHSLEPSGAGYTVLGLVVRCQEAASDSAYKDTPKHGGFPQIGAPFLTREMRDHQNILDCSSIIQLQVGCHRQ